MDEIKDEVVVEEPIVEGAEPTPPEKKEEVEEPAIDESEISDEDYNATMEKMSPRQLAAMNLRMRDKMAKLETERKVPPAPVKEKEPAAPAADQPPQFDLEKFDRIAMVSGNEYGRRAVAKIKSFVGPDSDPNELISAIIDIANIVSAGNSQHFVRQGIEPIASEFREGKFSKALATFAGDDKYKFVMSKPEIAKEVESYVRNNYQPEDWNKPETLKSAYGNVLSDHPEIFASAGKREIVNDGSPHERPAGGGSPTGGDGDWKKWALSQGMVITTQDDANTAKRAYSNFKGSEKASK